jgi:DNA repair protein RecN (Recombination protein N)
VLLELSIQRIALIESLQLQLTRGFNVFTGETGAGKSILLDSLGLLLGNRGSAELIRTGHDSGYVEALFDTSAGTEQTIIPFLSEWGITLDGQELIVSREIHRNGRNVCRVNGRLVTVNQLKDLGSMLVQQHGQHDHQGLLKPEQQLRALDLYANHETLVQAVKQRYHTWVEAKQALKSSRVEEQERVRRLDMLNFQIDEIEKVQLTPDEADELREQRRRLQHADKIANALTLAADALQGSENHSGVLGMLGLAAEELSSALAYEPDLTEIVNLVETSQVHADEAVRSLNRYLSTMESDPGQLEKVEARFAEIRHLERKYGPSMESVLEYLENARMERNQLLHHEQQMATLESELQNAEEKLHEVAQRLHEQRSAAATRLSTEVETVLRQLNMPNASFLISVQLRHSDKDSHAYTENGVDAVQYLFSANKGEEPKSLQKIASGGELSRTLLGMKAALAEVDELETLIFDEIDTGVSGSAAQAIADLMRTLALHRQVLCVTHSAQIAASANAHCFIRKEEGSASTQTTVEVLDSQGRVREIARLLGSDISDTTAVQHASALLERQHA